LENQEGEIKNLHSKIESLKKDNHILQAKHEELEDEHVKLGAKQNELEKKHKKLEEKHEELENTLIVAQATWVWEAHVAR
jgi:predicted  nucleic acid-binding Zn-ribbon protein